LTPQELAAELAAGRLRPAYLIAGEESLLRDDALAALRAAAHPAGPADFDLDRFEGGAIDAATLLDAVQTLPVIAQRRVVIVNEPEAKRSASRGVADALAELVASLEPGGSALLVVVAARPDRRLRWVKAFESSIVDCTAPTRPRDIAAFVRAEADRQEVRLERGVAELLAERTGPQLMLLRHEIAKLCLLAGPNASVSRAHVAAGTPDVAEQPIWDMADAIGEGRGADALHALARLLASGAAPQLLLGALVSHFRRLLRVASGGRVAGPPFARKKLESQAGRYGARRLRGSLEAIHETDLALKGAGALRPELALERLVIALSS
jgi:DNA polymerase III subunit delta